MFKLQRASFVAAAFFALMMPGVSPAQAQAQAHATHAVPGKKTVLRWLAADEKLTLEGALTKIILRSGEIAYVADLHFPDRGRNFSNGLALVRPGIQEAQLLEFSNAFLVKVSQRLNNAASLLEIEDVGSGQGTTASTKMLLYIDDWTPQFLHNAETRDNLGDCGQKTVNRDCESVTVDWQFVEASGDRAFELVEKITESKGAEEETMVGKTTVRRYALRKDWELVPLTVKR